MSSLSLGKKVTVKSFLTILELVPNKTQWFCQLQTGPQTLKAVATRGDGVEHSANLSRQTFNVCPTLLTAEQVFMTDLTVYFQFD